jgi:hypothetical protein
MRKKLRIAGLLMMVSFAAIQSVRPNRINPPVDSHRTLEAQVSVPAEVQAVLWRACTDCHSNETRWPWYSNVAPVSWFLADHVQHGRRHLNFSEWDRPRRGEQPANRLESICKEVRSGAMPLDSYLLLHRDARLTQDEVQAICAWAEFPTH